MPRRWFRCAPRSPARWPCSTTAPSVEGDLLVGASGVHSAVRAAVDPAAPAARYVGLTNFGGITRATPLAQELPAEAWQFVFGRHAFFGAAPHPGRRRRLVRQRPGAARSAASGGPPRRRPSGRRGSPGSWPTTPGRLVRSSRPASWSSPVTTPTTSARRPSGTGAGSWWSATRARALAELGSGSVDGAGGRRRAGRVRGHGPGVPEASPPSSPRGAHGSRRSWRSARGRAAPRSPGGSGGCRWRP